MLAPIFRGGFAPHRLGQSLCFRLAWIRFSSAASLSGHTTEHVPLLGGHEYVGPVYPSCVRDVRRLINLAHRDIRRDLAPVRDQGTGDSIVGAERLNYVNSVQTEVVVLVRLVGRDVEP